MPRNRLPANYPLSSAQLNDWSRDLQRQPPGVGPGTFNLLHRHLLPPDWQRIERCQGGLMRLEDPSGDDVMITIRCFDRYWCPTCVTLEHSRRAHWHERLYRSISPVALSGGENALAVYRWVFTTPPFLRDLVKNRENLDCAKQAVSRTLARVWGAETNREITDWRARHASVCNLHFMGESEKSFPEWSPHWDGTMSLWELDETGMPTRGPVKWPKSFSATRSIYREELRKALTPAVGDLRGDDRINMKHDLESEFPVVLYVGRTKLDDKPIHVFTEKHARFMIWYGTRPLWNPKGARLAHGTQNSLAFADEMVYDSQGGNRRWVVRARDAFRHLYRLRDVIDKAERHSRQGFLRGSAYKSLMERMGRKPELATPPSGRTLKAKYWPDHEGKFDVNNRYTPSRRNGHE